MSAWASIGNVGTNDEDHESDKIWTKGVIINAEITDPSNYRSLKHLDKWLKQNKIVGITGIDTRNLTNLIRDKGAPKGTISFLRNKKFNIKKLLTTTLQEDPGMIPYLAIGLFAGVRPMEIERLQKPDITERYIEITAANAKTRKRRLVNIAANLKKWLKISEELLPTNKTKRLSRILKKAGLEWKPDIMRHSFASYHLVLHESADKTALEMGHRDTQMLFRHYRELVTREEAKAYWEIKP